MTQQVHALDVITQNAGEIVRREQARDLAANVVQALFRLVKLATLHSLDNQAVVRQVDEAVELITDYGQRAGQNVSILFAHGSIFVGGQLLKANRGTYEGAMELGEVLKRCGASELAIAKDARAQDLLAFTSAVADAMRASTPQRLERPSPRVRLRAVGEAALKRGLVVERLAPDAAMVRAYASAVVIMRRFLEELQRGRIFLPQRVKRIAQTLVDLASGETPAFLGVTAVRNANHDDAGRAVNSAILAVSIARQVTTDPVTLVRLAMASLLYDCGRPRLTGVRPGEARSAIVPTLSEQQEEELPAGTAVVLTALGRVNEPSVMRTVIGYEAHWVKRQARLGPLYDGLRVPTLQARIIATARAFNDLLTPAPGAAAMSADQAIARLESEAADAADRNVLRLLFGALGIFPTGTLVELSTGEVALVVATPAHPSRYSQPRVRLVFDATGGTLDRPVEIDLAVRPGKGEPRRHIRKVVAMAGEAGASMRDHAQPSVPPPAQPGRGTSAPTSLRGGSGTMTPTSSQNSAADLRSKVTTPPPSQAAGSSRVAVVAPPSVRVVDEDLQPDDPDPELEQATRAVPWTDPGPLAPPERASPRPAAGEAHRAPATPAPPPTPLTRGDPAPPTSTPAPQATAEGSFMRTPPLHLLVYMLDQRLTGTTVFQEPDGTAHGVYFHEGAPAKVRTGTMIAPLDRVLVELGMLDEASLRTSLVEISKKRVLHGRYLVSRGLLEREQVVTALRHQVVKKMMHVFELPPETLYAYYEGVNLLASYGGPELTPCEPLALIMSGIRLRADDPLVAATLERISGRPMALHLDSEMRRFELSRQESAICDLLRARRMTLAELLGAGAAPERVVRTFVYALAITRHLDLGAPGRPPVGLVARDRGAVSSVTNQGHVAIREAAPSPPVAAPPCDVAAEPGPGARPTTPPTGAPPSSPPSGVSESNPPSSPASPAPRRTGFGVSFGQPKAAEAASRGSSPSDVQAPPSDPPRSGESSTNNARISDPGSGSRSSERAGPESLTTGQRYWSDLPARRLEIARRLTTLDQEDHFQLLGLARDASHDQVQKAYFSIAKTWHPDRLPAELADLKPQISRAFARFNDAYQLLNDPAKRHAYTKDLEGGRAGPDDQEMIGRVVEAALEFQKAEVLLKKQDLNGAEMLARRAASADPEQPEYLTLLVWIQAQRRGEPAPLAEGKTSAHYDDLIGTLDKVLAKEPRYERALFYRGMLLKRSGRADRAIRDFRLSAEINPKNLDAVREVRVHDMRHRRGAPTNEPAAPPPTNAGGGLLGKLFKK